MKWQGKHTSGNCNIRGTRVWFNPSSCKVVNESDDDEITNELDVVDFSENGDDTALRSEDLQTIIDDLSNIKGDILTQDMCTEIVSHNLIFKDKYEIINELTYINKKALEKQVTFIWV